MTFISDIHENVLIFAVNLFVLVQTGFVHTKTAQQTRTIVKEATKTSFYKEFLKM